MNSQAQCDADEPEMWFKAEVSERKFTSEVTVSAKRGRAAESPVSSFFVFYEIQP